MLRGFAIANACDGRISNVECCDLPSCLDQSTAPRCDSFDSMVSLLVLSLHTATMACQIIVVGR